MYRRRLEELPAPQQTLALDYRGEVLEQLNSPYEMQVFFDEMRGTPISDASKNNRRIVQESIIAAHRSSIESRIETHVRESGYEVEAICLWALLSAHRSVSYAELEVFAGCLCDINESKYENIPRLASRLAAGRRLRQSGDVLSYHHPSVEAGLLRLVIAEHFSARRVLAEVVRALIQVQGVQDTGSWGELGAARVIAAASQVDGLMLVVPDEVGRCVDAWLERQLTSGEDFETRLILAAEAGSKNSVVSEVAQLLTNKLTFSPFSIRRARPVDLSEDAVIRMKSGALTRRMVERYITDVLPYKSDSFRPGLAALFHRIAGETDEAYANAAATALAVGRYSAPTEQIFPSALGLSPQADRLTVTALDALDLIGMEPDQAEWDKYENGWYDDHYEEHWYQANAEEWKLLDEWLSGYVDHARRDGGWRELSQKPFAPRLAGWWMQSAGRESRPALLCSGEEEFKNLLAFAVADESCEVTFWNLATTIWYDSASDHLVSRLVKGSDRSERIEAAISCLFAVAPHLFERVEERLLQEQDFSRLFELFVELTYFVARQHVDFEPDSDWVHSDEERERIQDAQEKRAALLKRWIDRQAEPLLEVLSTFDQLDRESFELSDDAEKLLRDLKPTSTIASLRKIEVCAGVGCVDAGEVASLLSQATSADVAEKLVAIAAKTEHWSVVEASLGHRFAKAQAAAIASLVARDPTALTPAVLDLGRGHSKYVKKSLLKAIEEYPLPQYLDALVEMTGDRWLGDDPYGIVCYPFARMAANQVQLYGELSGAFQSALMSQAIATDDPELRDILFDRVIAQGGASGRAAVLLRTGRNSAADVANAAARACVRNMSSFTSEDLLSVTVDQVKESGVHVASALMILLGRLGPNQAIEDLALHISQQPFRKVFLVLLLAAIDGRDELFSHIHKLLPTGHPAHAIFVDPDHLLPRTALDDLGSVRNVRIVRDWLDAKFEKSPIDSTSWVDTDGPIDEGYEGTEPGDGRALNASS